MLFIISSLDHTPNYCPPPPSPVMARGLSRECVLRIPSVSSKGNNWSRVSESPNKKVGPRETTNSPHRTAVEIL